MNTTNAEAQPLTAPERTPAPSKRSALLLVLLAVLMVMVPFFTWYLTWFGRRLSDRQIAEYLSQTEKPRKAQHALNQIALRLNQGDKSIREWYPKIIRLAEHEAVPLRVTIAWFMGLEGRSDEFHQTLLMLLHDPEPIVARNAALSLVRFGDARGRPQLRRMLAPHMILAPANGWVSFRLQVGDPLDQDTLVARINRGEEEAVEIRSGLPGTLRSKLIEEDAPVREGTPLLLVSPSREHVWEALRALYLVGEPDDVSLIRTYERGMPGVSEVEEIRRQARQTREAIFNRNKGKRSAAEK